MAVAGLWRAGVTAWMLGTWGVTGWTLSQHPFAEPVIARTADEARRALDRAVARQASADWLVAEIEAALAADDPLDIALLVEIADTRGIVLPPGRLRRPATAPSAPGTSPPARRWRSLAPARCRWN